MGMSKHLMFELEDAEDELEAALDTPDDARIAAAWAAVEQAEALRDQWNAHLGRLMRETDKEAEKQKALPRIDPISEREFNDLVGHMKSHASDHIHKELGWFASENRSAVGAALAARRAEPGEVVVADLRADGIDAAVARTGVVHRDPGGRFQAGTQHLAGLRCPGPGVGDDRPHRS
jgi:hypothetical protein